MASILQRLREPPFGTETSERNLFNAAADKIEQLEMELAEMTQLKDSHAEVRSMYFEQLAAEKALADRLAEKLDTSLHILANETDEAIRMPFAEDVLATYRKARGL